MSHHHGHRPHDDDDDHDHDGEAPTSPFVRIADRMEDLEKLIHKELKRNTDITDNAQTIAEEIRAQVPLLERTHADVGRLLAAMSPASVVET
jgi:hypothetical protein